MKRKYRFFKFCYRCGAYRFMRPFVWSPLAWTPAAPLQCPSCGCVRRDDDK